MKKPKWFKWERDSTIHPLFYSIEGGMFPLKKRFGKGWPTTYCIFENDFVVWLNDYKKLNNTGIFLINRFLNDKYYTKTMSEWNKEIEGLRKIHGKIDEIELKKLSDGELIKLFNEFSGVYSSWWCVGMLAEPVGYGCELLLHDKLLKILKIKSFDKKTMNYFNVLTSPLEPSFTNYEEKSLMNILEKLNKGENVDKLLKEHVKNFHWIRNNYLETKYLNENYFLEELKVLQEQKINPKKVIEGTEKRLQETRKEKERVIRELKLDEKTKKIAKIASDFCVFQDTRKRYNLESNYYVDLFLTELGRRRNITLKELKFSVHNEFGDILNGKLDRNVLEERMKHSLVVHYTNSYKIYVGKEAEDEEKRIFGKDSSVKGITELAGQCASPGKIQAIAKIIKSPKELDKLNKGDVLITSMTSPDFVVGMKKASAIVTNEGGITSHAAIVSRELSIPCLIATKIATEVFNDGDVIEVNADKGIVRKIR